MKKLTLRKGKAMACLIFVCLFLAQSCRKDSLMPNSNDLQNGLSVAEAKAHFEKNFQKPVKPKTLMSTESLNSSITPQDIVNGKQPMWDASILRGLSIKTNAVLVPLHKEGVFVNISEKKMVKFGFLNYMMMYKDDKDNIITEWVELRPTEKWINSKISRKYEGRILVKDWNGKIKRVIDFKEENLNRTPNNTISSKKISGIKGRVMSNDEQQICFYTTIYTITTGRSLCSCKGHTYEIWAAGGCTCGDIPKQGYTTTITYETSYDCLSVEDGGPSGGSGGGPPSGGNGQPPTGNGNGGGTNPDDYAPIHCNPDPNYVVPTTPPPPGQEYIIPCSEMSIPDEDIPDPNTNPQPLTSTELIIHYYNADPNTDMHLSDSEVSFLNNNPNIVEELLNYLQTETLETKEFGKWAIGYLNENRDVSLEKFKSQFLATSEGQDGVDDFDENYWNNPNLIIAPQVLPSFALFSLAYPKNASGTLEMDAPSVFNLVGGTPKALRDATLSDADPSNDNTYSNACALRVSRALNYSGVPIPAVSGTYKGGDGKNYFLSAASLNAWMTKAFPPTSANSIKLTGADSGKNGSGFASALDGYKGIYIMIPNYPGHNYFAASGHAGLHTDPPVTHYYFTAKGGVSKITLWRLN